MKIAITGNTGQIGSPLTKSFEELGHDVVGISRSSGYDLTTEIGQLNAVDKICECDVFVNLAWPPSQVKMLEYVWNRWEGDRSKLIINIGTTSTVLPSYKLIDINYYKIKKELDDKHWRLIDKGNYPRMTLVRAGMGVGETNFNGWAKFLTSLVETDYHIFDITYGKLNK